MKPLTDYINKQYTENQHDNAGAIHPSSLGDCDRFPIYQYLGVEKDVEHSQFLKRIFFHGYAIEDWMNAALKDKGILIASSVPVKAEVGGIPIEGTIDHIIKWNGGWCIADTKSQSDYAFRYRLPKSNHILQVGAYEWMLGEFCKLPFDTILEEVTRMKAKSGDRDRRLGCPYTMLYDEEHFGPEFPPVLFYIGRGNLEEEPIQVGPQAQEWAYEKLQLLAHYAKNGIIPDVPFQSPNEHPYLCADTIRKGRKRKDGTYSPGQDPLYAPSCAYFGRCWGLVRKNWSYWSEVKK